MYPPPAKSTCRRDTRQNQLSLEPATVRLETDVSSTLGFASLGVGYMPSRAAPRIEECVSRQSSFEIQGAQYRGWAAIGASMKESVNRAKVLSKDPIVYVRAAGVVDQTASDVEMRSQNQNFVAHSNKRDMLTTD